MSIYLYIKKGGRWVSLDHISALHHLLLYIHLVVSILSSHIMFIIFIFLSILFFFVVFFISFSFSFFVFAFFFWATCCYTPRGEAPAGNVSD